MHNIITLRGALVRDAKQWAKYLDETLALYGSTSDVLFAGHGWPTWDTPHITAFVAAQRDLYAYTHDQTIRLLNQGLNGAEIAEQLVLPPALQRAWPLRGFYGSLSHNVKAVYQRYMTWFDGNPANLWKHPRAAEGQRYVACMGGAAALLQHAKAYADADDLRFAATLLDHLLAAEPDNLPARAQLAAVYERLGFGAENATWRNFYLTGAQEMRKAPTPAGARAAGSPWSLSTINPQSGVGDWLDGLSVRLDGPRACVPVERGFVVAVTVPEEGATYVVRLSNGTLTFRRRGDGEGGGGGAAAREEGWDLHVRLSKGELYRVLAEGDLGVAAARSEGDASVLATLLDLCGIEAAGGEKDSRL